MNPIFKYSTTYLRDKFAIISADGSSGCLFKTSWVGGYMDIKDGEEMYRILKTGSIFNRKVFLTGKDKVKVAEIYIAFPFFRPGRQCKVVLASGGEYYWKESGLFNRKWEITEGGRTVIHSKENNGLFTIDGEVEGAVGEKDSRLLSIVGLYLRSAFGMQNALTFWLGIFIFVFLGLRYFNS